MRRYIAILLCMAVAFGAAACQPTPEQAIVVKKDTDRMVEQAAQPSNGAAIDEVGIPEGRYTFSAEGLNGRLRINIYAEIEAPAAQAMPIVRVEQGGFSQEIVTKVFNYFYAGETAYDASGEHVETKAEIEPLIIDAKRCLADGSYAERGYTEEEYVARLKQIEKIYAAAPETAPASPVSDGTMRMTELENVGDYLQLNVDTDRAKDTARSMSVLTPISWTSANSGFGAHLYYRVYSRTKKGTEYNTQGILRTNGTNLPEAARQKLAIDFDEAKALCDGVFTAAGLADNYTFGHAFLVGDAGMGKYGGNGKELGAPAENYAYRLYYTRIINGVPCFVNTDNGLNDANNGATSLPWSYECIVFTVDSSGLSQLSWSNPVKVVETVTENAVILPFDKIMDVFESMIKVEYEAFLKMWEGNGGEMDITIDKLELCLVRVREQNSEATGLLVPAWVFYGNNKVVHSNGSVSYDLAHGSGSTWNKEPFPVLTINAIDGSIIDLGKGY